MRGAAGGDYAKPHRLRRLPGPGNVIYLAGVFSLHGQRRTGERDGAGLSFKASVRKALFLRVRGLPRISSLLRERGNAMSHALCPRLLNPGFGDLRTQQLTCKKRAQGGRV